jgi:hypothetical protein
MGRLREKAIAGLKNYLLRTGLPRVQMSLIVLVTGFAGFFFSAAALKAGLTEMWIRYGLAMFFAYLVFLLLVRVWAEYHRGRLRELPDVLPVDEGGAEPVYSRLSSDSDHRWLDWVDLPGDFVPDDFDLGCLIVLPIILIVGAVLACAAVVTSAPELLAEVFLDAVVLSALYRRLKHIQAEHWVKAVLRRTIWPFVGITLLFMIGGGLIQGSAPQAHSLGGAWRLWQQRSGR